MFASDDPARLPHAARVLRAACPLSFRRAFRLACLLALAPALSACILQRDGASASRLDAILTYDAFGQSLSRQFGNARRILIPQDATNIRVSAFAEDAESGVLEISFPAHGPGIRPEGAFTAEADAPLYRAHVAAALDDFYKSELRRFAVQVRNGAGRRETRFFEISTIDELVPGAPGCPPVPETGERLKTRLLPDRPPVRSFLYFRLLDTAPCSEELVESSKAERVFALGGAGPDPARFLFLGDVTGDNRARTQYHEDRDAEYRYYSFRVDDDASPVVVASTIRSFDRKQWKTSIPLTRIYHPRNFDAEPILVRYRLDLAISGAESERNGEKHSGWRLDEIALTLCGKQECAEE